MSLPPSHPSHPGSPSHSHLYDDDFSHQEGHSFLSDLPSATSDDAHSEPDSLADASPEQVQDRALAFLTQSPKSSQLLNKLNPLSQSSLAQAGALDPFTDIPRKQPTTEQAKQDAHADAVAFLRKCLAAVDETSWQYHTPAPFDPPQSLGPKAQREDTDGLAGQDDDWPDSGFNLASYPTPPGAEPREQLVEGAGGAEGGWADDDGEVPQRVTMEEGGNRFGESGVDGFDRTQPQASGGAEATFGGATSWGARGSLVRRVSELGM